MAGGSSVLVPPWMEGTTHVPGGAATEAAPHGPCESARVVLAAPDVQRHVPLVADDPAVLGGRHVEELAGLHHPLGPVVHRDRSASAEDEADVLDPAGLLAARLAHVLGPPPAGLVGGPAERHGADSVDLEAPLLEGAGLGGVV